MTRGIESYKGRQEIWTLAMKREQAVDVVLSSFIDISIVCATRGVFYRVDLQAEVMEVSIACGEVAMMNTSLDADIP